jgi:hypothetical protein
MVAINDRTHRGADVKVVLYLESEPDQWSAEAIYDVAECFPDDPEGAALAIADLERCGEHIYRWPPTPTLRLRLVKFWP